MASQVDNHSMISAETSDKFLIITKSRTSEQPISPPTLYYLTSALFSLSSLLTLTFSLTYTLIPYSHTQSPTDEEEANHQAPLSHHDQPIHCLGPLRRQHPLRNRRVLFQILRNFRFSCQSRKIRGYVYGGWDDYYGFESCTGTGG